MNNNDEHTTYEYVSFEHLRHRSHSGKNRWWLNLILLLATILTTTLAGALMSGEVKLNIKWFLSGFQYSAPLLIILGIHEMGHYIASNLHRIKATLPYFIPMPTMIGTFGAFIRIKDPIVDRRALMDIGAAGPLAGFIAAIPVLVWGMMTSTIVKVQETAEVMRLGESLILKLASLIFWGNVQSGYEVNLSAPAFAAWLGLFVTSLNLLPLGQLDGGHIAYAMWGDRAYRISRIVFFSLIPFGFFWLGWLFWALVMFLVMGLRHPPLVDPYVPLGRRRKIIGYICIAVFILTFTPIPFEM